MNDLIENVLKSIIIKTKDGNLISLLKRFIFRIRKLAYVLYLKTNIKKFDVNFTPKNLVDFVFNYGEGLLNPLQVRSEILMLIQLLKKEKPKLILEIGTANGGTLFLFSRIADKDAIIISIDVPGGRYGGGYPKWRIPLYKLFCLSNQKALIAFHDIVIHPIALNVGVNEFWNEIKQNYEYMEIVEDWNQKRCGIGILKKI